MPINVQDEIAKALARLNQPRTVGTATANSLTEAPIQTGEGPKQAVPQNVPTGGDIWTGGGVAGGPAPGVPSTGPAGGTTVNPLLQQFYDALGAINQPMPQLTQAQRNNLKARMAAQGDQAAQAGLRQLAGTAGGTGTAAYALNASRLQEQASAGTAANISNIDINEKWREQDLEANRRAQLATMAGVGTNLFSATSNYALGLAAQAENARQFDVTDTRNAAQFETIMGFKREESDKNFLMFEASLASTERIEFAKMDNTMKMFTMNLDQKDQQFVLTHGLSLRIQEYDEKDRDDARRLKQELVDFAKQQWVEGAGERASKERATTITEDRARLDIYALLAAFGASGYTPPSGNVY